MKFDLKSISPLEILLFVLFVVYIVFSIPTPFFLIPLLDSPLGLGIVIITTLYLFLYTTPILGILSIFVAYEMLRRSCNVTGKTQIMKYTPTQVKKDKYMKEMNPPTHVLTLEEEIVKEMAPIGKSDPSTYIDTSYKPIADKLMDGVALF
jgi:hypothetical protein